MPTYTKADEYLATATTLADRITKIDSIIAALLVLATTATDDQLYEEYELDDGQTKIKARYRGQKAIMAAIKGWENMKNYYINQSNGRTMRLIDGKNFTGC